MDHDSWFPCWLDTNRQTIPISLLNDLEPADAMLNLALGFIPIPLV
jgi:hypothetical protein